MEEIKSEVASLSEDGRARLREWFSEKDSRERAEGTGRNPGSDGLSGESSGGGEKRKRRYKKLSEEKTGSCSRRGAKPAEGSEEILQEYECRVRAIYEDDGTFIANLIDLTAGEIWPSDTAEFSIGDISDDDRSLFRKGAVFYWIKGRRVLDGREESFERLQFDPSLLTMSDFILMEQRERRLEELLGPEDED